MRRRIAKGFVALLAVLALLPAATLWYATCTEPGLKLVINILSRKLGPVQMWISGASGTFADGFRVEHFRLIHERVEVRADGISGRVSVLPLLWATINSHDAHIDRAFVHVLPHTPTGKALTRFLPPFLSIVTEAARIDSATVVVPNGRQLDATQLIGSGGIRWHDMNFHDAKLRMGDVEIQANTTLTAHEPLQLRGESRWIWTARNQPQWLFTADFTGDLGKLDLRSAFTLPFQAQFTGALLDLTRDWHWQGTAAVNNLDIRAWGASGLLGRISGSLALQGNRDGFLARGPLDSVGLDAGVFDTVFEGSYADRVLSARRIEIVNQSSHGVVNASGTIRIIPGGPALALRGSWHGFQWPLRGQGPALTSPAGEFTLSGEWPYAVLANGRVKPTGLPEFPAQLRGSLAKDRLIVAEGRAELWGGRAVVSGEAIWALPRSWKFTGKAENLDSSQLRADLPGRLSFSFSASGNRFGSDTDLDLQMRDLTGRLRGAAARGAGHIVRKTNVWNFDHVNVAAGGANLAIDGSIGATANLDFRLTASDLSIVAPQSRGRISATGSFKGSTDAPIIRFVASGSGIRHEAITLRSLEADVNIDTRPGKDLHADIRLRDLGTRDRVVNKLDFSLIGTSDANQVSLSAQAVGTRLSASAQGGFVGREWRGHWQNFAVDDNAELHLKLESPAALRVANNGGALERFCLRGSAAHLCALGGWDGKHWSVETEATELPMSALTAGLTPKVAYEGRLDVHAGASATGDGPIEGKLRVELTDAQLRRQRSNSRVDLIRLGSGTISATADRDALRASFNLDAMNIGSVSGEMTAQRAGYAIADMPLRGSIKASTRELDFINIYVPDVDRAVGKMVADIAVGGSLGRPLVSGIVQLSDGELDLYQVNLQLRKVAMLAKINDNRIDFSANGSASDGTLSVHGDLAWTEGAPRGSLQLLGSNLLVVNVPEARITASPDLKFTVDGRKINVTGTVTIPTARIAPADLTGAVLSSSDEVLVGAQTVDPANRTQVTSNIRMVLGERVNVETFGLSGRLTGSISAQTSADGVSRGAGELNIADGKYAAFGRRLDVQRGRLIFGGGLLADPGVDLRATKQFPDVVAGVNVRGTLRQPRMTFFSEPALPQSQIVSLILAGGSLESAQSSASSGTARGELLAQGGAIIAQQLGQRVGIDDVSIEQSLTNETSLVLGKYLSPRLYVSYGVSLAESINTIKMRYTLGDRWTIKTEAGKERSADLVYTIEK